MQKNLNIFEKKSNEVLQGVLLVLDQSNNEIDFEHFEEKFPEIKGKRLGSLIGAISRIEIDEKRLITPFPIFGSRRKKYKLNKHLTTDTLQELKNAILSILSDRK